MKKIQIYLTLVFAGVFSPHLIAETPCGEARIVSGASCRTLRVEFNLLGCGGNQKEQATVICEGEQVRAQWLQDKYVYMIPVRELSPGVWTLVGSVRQYPKNWAQEPIKKTEVRFRGLPPGAKTDEWPSLFELGGEFRYRIEENRKNDFLSNRGFSSVRLRLGFSLRPNEALAFFIEPQANQILGQPILMPAIGNVNAYNGTSGVNQDPNLGFHQAFGEIRLGTVGRLILGRQVLAYGDEVLVGASDWENPGRSFDGVRSRIEWGLSWWDLFSTKIWDSQAQANGEGDKDFHGTYISWSHPNKEIELQPYFFWLRDHRVSLQQLFSAGIHTRFRLLELDMKAEMTGQWGQRTGQQAWVELKSIPFSSLGLQIGVDGFWSSPDFTPLFPTSHRWLGWADVLGRRNTSGIGGTLNFRFSDGPEFSLRLLHFLRTHTEFPVYAFDGATVLQHSLGNSQTLGSELDVICRMKWFRTVDFLAAASLFYPSLELRKAYNTEAWLGRLEASVSMSF